MHCTNCTDQEMLDMKLVLRNKTPECDSFITHREVMPLYWRTWTKCQCLLSLGERHTAAALVTCPFTRHAAKTDMVAYDNCVNPSVNICEFTLADLFGMYCYNTEFERRELLWSMHEVIIP